MTNEEAINALKRIRVEAINNFISDWEDYEAFGIAIKALASRRNEPLEAEWIDRGWKGDWQFETDGRGNCWKAFECSNCNTISKVQTNFCSNCGTDMRGEK